MTLSLSAFRLRLVRNGAKLPGRVTTSRFAFRGISISGKLLLQRSRPSMEVQTTDTLINVTERPLAQALPRHPRGVRLRNRSTSRTMEGEAVEIAENGTIKLPGFGMPLKAVRTEKCFGNALFNTYTS